MENKKSKLCFDAKIVRKILKRNPQMEEKYCRYCGTPLANNCACPQPSTIIDIKPLRDDPNGKSVFIFANTEAFQSTFAQVMDEIKAKKESEKELEDERIPMDLD